MELKVGDILETSKKDVILIAEINSNGLVVGYWGADYLRNIGYLTYINEKLKAGSWKYYPVVK